MAKSNNRTAPSKDPYKRVKKCKVGDIVKITVTENNNLERCLYCGEENTPIDENVLIEKDIAFCCNCEASYLFVGDNFGYDIESKAEVVSLQKSKVKNKSEGRAKKGTLSEEKPYILYGKAARLFGVHIPPKKQFKPKKYLTLRFVITGVIPSKKNDFVPYNNIRQIMPTAIKKFGYTKPAFEYIQKNAKSWLRGSKKYLEWLDEIDESFREQMEYWRVKYNLIYPLDFVSIKNYYFFADNTARDTISKDESIYDMLVNKRLILEDDYSVLHKTTSEAANYKNEIRDSIVTIDVTVSIFDKT